LLPQGPLPNKQRWGFAVSKTAAIDASVIGDFRGATV
jgi:hypothetical protein